MKMFAICVSAVLYLFHVSKVSSLYTDTEHSCAYFKTAPMNGFNKTLYAGQWFTYQLYDFGDDSLNTENFDCYVQLRTQLADGNHELVDILINAKKLRFQIDGQLTFDQPGKGHYLYSSTSNDFTGSYDILYTDFTTFTIEWSCVDLAGGGSVSDVFILSRLPVVLSTTKIKIGKVLDKYHIDKTKLRTTNPLSCSTEFLKQFGGGGLLGGVLGLVGGIVGLVANLLGGLLNALLG